MFGMGCKSIVYDCLMMGCSGDVMGKRCKRLGTWLDGDGMFHGCDGMEM